MKREKALYREFREDREIDSYLQVVGLQALGYCLNCDLGLSD